MGPGYRCAHYELLPCDRELQILSTIPQVVEPSTVSLRGVSTIGVPIYISYFV